MVKTITISFAVSGIEKLVLKGLNMDIGIPLTELQALPVTERFSKPQESHQSTETAGPSKTNVSVQKTIKSPAAITFVRNRMFYARAALNAKGTVRVGLRHIRKP